MSFRPLFITNLVALALFTPFVKDKGIKQSTETTINVVEQKDFDSLNHLLSNAINHGFTTITVCFSPGTFYYGEEHIRLVGLNNPSLVIRFVGNRTILVSKGKDFLFSHYKEGQLHASFNESDFYGTTFVDDKYEMIDLDGELQEANGIVEIVDYPNKICRLPINSASEVTDEMKILITRWYKSGIYPVTKIKNGYAYFYVSDLKKSSSYDCYNVNLDFGFSRGTVNPRYRVFNTPGPDRPFIKSGEFFIPATMGTTIHQCSASRFVYVSNLVVDSISFTGFEFIGNKESSSLFQFHRVSSNNLSIENCSFRYLRNIILLINSSDNVVFSKNIVEDCFNDCVVSDNGSSRTIVSYNRFNRNGMRMHQHCCVNCQGENYHIHHNVFSDFSYSAINLGVYYQYPMIKPCSGIVEYNDIYYSKEFFSTYSKHTLMDSGAIYVTTQNQDAVIRYNTIHDYIGMKENRGIFCDTGTKNTIIYGNILWNIPNSNAIELWNVDEPVKLVPDSNTRNSVYENIIVGKYQFEGRALGKNIHKRNVVVKNSSDPDPMIVLRNLDKQEKDIIVNGYFDADNVLFLPRSVRREVRRTAAYKALGDRINFY